MQPLISLLSRVVPLACFVICLRLGRGNHVLSSKSLLQLFLGPDGLSGNLDDLVTLDLSATRIEGREALGILEHLSCTINPSLQRMSLRACACMKAPAEKLRTACGALCQSLRSPFALDLRDTHYALATGDAGNPFDNSAGAMEDVIPMLLQLEMHYPMVDVLLSCAQNSAASVTVQFGLHETNMHAKIPRAWAEQTGADESEVAIVSWRESRAFRSSQCSVYQQMCARFDGIWTGGTKPGHVMSIPIVDFRQPLTLNVKDQTGMVTCYKVSYRTRMDKIFNAHAQRQGSDKAALRFLVDGERVQGDATPRSLQLTDGDQVDVLLEQCGD